MQYLVLEPVVHIQLPYIYDSKFNDISINSFLFLITGKSWRLLTLKGSDCQSFLFLFYQPEATKLSFLGRLFFFRAPLFFKNSCEFLQLTSTVTFSGILFLSFFFCSVFLLPLQCLWAPEIFNFFPVFYIIHQLPCFVISFLGGMFTANTMSSVVETLGLSLPGLWWFSYQLKRQTCRSPPPEQCSASAVMLDREAHFGKGLENINKKQDRRKTSLPRSKVLPLIVNLS